MSMFIARMRSYPIWLASLASFSYFSLAGLFDAFINSKMSNKISSVYRLSASMASWICSLVKMNKGYRKYLGISISEFVISSTRS